MSIRGFITQGAKGKEMVAETAHYIPPAWLCLFNEDNLAECIEAGLIALDKASCVEEYLQRCEMIYRVFPELKIADSSHDPLLARLNTSRSKKIHINLEEFFEFENTGATLAWQALDSGDLKFKHTIPAQNVTNPSTGESIRTAKVVLKSAREALLFGCSINEGDLEDASSETISEYCFGHIWD